MAFGIRKMRLLGQNSVKRFTTDRLLVFSKRKSQGELDLPWRVGVGGPQERDRTAIGPGKVVDSKVVIQGYKLPCGVQETLIGGGDSLVRTIEQVERFDQETQLPASTQPHVAAQPQIHGRVVGSYESISAVPRQAVVIDVAVLVGI